MGAGNKNGEQQHHLPPSLAQSKRFEPPETRRDFLGLAAIWTALGTCFVALIGAMRLPMPSVFPESNSKSKIGPPSAFKKGSATHLPLLQAWVYRDADGGMYAMSSVCTHLGCIAARQDSGEFLCPCHGSRFGTAGDVLGGPAPSGLNWLGLSVAPDGQLVLDRQRLVKQGTRLVV